MRDYQAHPHIKLPNDDDMSINARMQRIEHIGSITVARQHFARWAIISLCVAQIITVIYVHAGGDNSLLRGAAIAFTAFAAGNLTRDPHLMLNRLVRRYRDAKARGRDAR